MPVRSVQISLDEELLALVDKQPETKERGRSAVIRDALRMYIERSRAAAIDEQYRKAYSDRSATEFDELLSGQAWPSE